MTTQQTDPAAEPTGKAGRYNRSAAGLIASLLVTVIGVGALLYFMGLFRNDLEIKPESVDYLETVASAQQGGLTPTYPPTLPEGWIATGVDVTPGDRPIFMIRLLTDDNRFIGIRSENASASSLARAWVDEEADPADGYTVPDDVRGPVAREWTGYTDDGGDTAYAAELEDETILVFGSAPAEDLQAVVDSLTTAPVPPAERAEPTKSTGPTSTGPAEPAN